MNRALILLAAGNSRRFQKNKLLYEIENKPMYLHIADQTELLQKELFQYKIVVSQYTEIIAAMKKRGFQTIENTHSELGISYSIRLGIQGLKTFVGREKLRGMGICFAVCDQPYLKAATIARLMEEWEASNKGIGCVCHQNTQGNPVVFSGRYIKELLSLTGDTGGKCVLKAHMGDVYRCELEDGRELMDIDTLTDL